MLEADLLVGVLERGKRKSDDVSSVTDDLHQLKSTSKTELKRAKLIHMTTDKYSLLLKLLPKVEDLKVD
jgi:hypothetical protein